MGPGQLLFSGLWRALNSNLAKRPAQCMRRLVNIGCFPSSLLYWFLQFCFPYWHWLEIHFNLLGEKKEAQSVLTEKPQISLSTKFAIIEQHENFASGNGTLSLNWSGIILFFTKWEYVIFWWLISDREFEDKYIVIPILMVTGLKWSKLHTFLNTDLQKY